MKIQLQQKMQDEFGKDVIYPGKPPLTLKDVIVASILAPVRDEEERSKQEKWDVFKKIRDKKDEVELKAEEVTIIKKAISKFQSQLFMGEANEMIEGTYKRMIPEIEEEEGETKKK